MLKVFIRKSKGTTLTLKANYFHVFGKVVLLYALVMVVFAFILPFCLGKNINLEKSFFSIFFIGCYGGLFASFLTPTEISCNQEYFGIERMVNGKRNAAWQD